ncbi:MAG: Zn-dependent hydrolase [Nitrospiraceae bacterium]
MNHSTPDQVRLTRDIEALAHFCDPSRPGFTRRPFTEWYARARDWLGKRMEEAGLQVRIDAVGNVIGKRAGKQDMPVIMLGSHIDTVDGGGRYDGMVGVVAAIEVARCIDNSGIALNHPLEVVSFFAEEPTDFGVSAVGSRAMAGVLDEHLLQQKDPVGQTLGEAMQRSGFDPRKLDAARRDPREISVYLELHIEQGPSLEQIGQPVGVVRAITGFCRHRFTWTGRPDHAGTMPMGLRKDALAGACESILDIESRCQHEAEQLLVGTVARISVWPNATNVVPERVEFLSDVRSPSASLLEMVCEANFNQAKIIARRRGLEVEITQITAELPIEVPMIIREAAAEAVKDLRLDPVELVSMAGHDANQLARIVPVGMIFVRCRDGRSHCPEEESSPQDVTLGTSSLLGLVGKLDQRLT